MLGNALLVSQLLLQETHIALLNNLSWGLPDKNLSILCFCFTWLRQADLQNTSARVQYSTLCLLRYWPGSRSRLSAQYLSTLAAFPYSAPFTPHLSLWPPSQGRRGPRRRAEDSSAPIRRQRELVSIKWYVLMPQITDTCSPLPSHPPTLWLLPLFSTT